MITHHTLENLNEVKLCFSKDGDPHLNGESHLDVNFTDGMVRLVGSDNVEYEAPIAVFVAEAMEALGIKCKLRGVSEEIR